MKIPQLQPSTPERTARSLRKVLARHNGRVLGVAALTLFAAVALWLIVYAASCWLILLAQTVADFPLVGLPPLFHPLFAAVAGAAILFAWLLRRLNPDDFPREDKTAWEHGGDFLLAIPRITLSIGGTLGAWLHLSHADHAQAAALLHRLADARSLPLQNVPIEIPDDAARARILFALQLTRVIDLRRRDREWWIVLHSQRPQELMLR